MTQAVLTDIKDGVMVITINRPEARNALNGAVAEGLYEAINRLDQDDEICVAILTGAGRGFCAGMDLKAFVSGDKSMANPKYHEWMWGNPPRKPIIAAVEGFAVAGGFELAISCDLIVASETAKLGIPEVKRGLVAAGGGLIKLPQQASLRIAMEMALTGDNFSASRMMQLGLINRCVPEGTALDVARELARKICENGPLAVAATKKILQNVHTWPASEARDKQKEITDPVFASADAIEGSKAFAEKRKPVWKAV